jgi:hypothetical protein
MTITIVFPAQQHVQHDEHGWPRNGFKKPGNNASGYQKSTAGKTTLRAG